MQAHPERNYPARIQIRLPSSLRDWLDRTHERTRIPRSELVRFALSELHDHYTTPKGQLDRERLVLDVAEDLYERGLTTSRPRDHAAA